MTAKQRIQDSQARIAQRLALIKIEKYLDRLDLERLEYARDLDFEAPGNGPSNLRHSPYNAGKRPRWGG